MKRLENVLRGTALLIVIAAIVDPVFTVRRAVRPVVSLLSADSARHAGTMAEVERTLARVTTVVRGPASNAQATVIVGSALPNALQANTSSTDSAATTRPRYVVPIVTEHGVHVEAIEAPASWMRDARMTVRVRLARDSGYAASPVTLSLRDDGQLQAQRPIALAAQQRAVVDISFTPVRDGTRVLELIVADGKDTLRYAHAVQVSASPWRVLVYDARPSWLSTFVRRALERDNRFAVSSRIVTSKDLSVATPQSARSFETLVTLANQDASSLPQVIVVGAPERLSARDVSALRALMEEWGRAVILLPDHLPPSPNQAGLNSLLGVTAWRALPQVPTSNPRAITRTPGGIGDSLHLAASAVATPTVLPADATTLAVSSGAPIIWARPVGRGSLLTSGGFDAWRFRDSAQSTFDATWRELIAAAAQDVNPALTFVRLGSASILHPNTLAQALIVGTRGSSPVPPTVALLKADSSGTSPLPVAVYPTATDHTWLTQVRVPSAGIWQLRATSTSDTAVLPLVTSPGTTSGPAGGLDTPREQLKAWTESTGGRLVPIRAIDSLPAILESRMAIPRQPAPWRPMRSAWWILPLTLALGGDWWLRRRRGAR